MKYHVDPNEYDPIDAMRTAEWMEEAEKREANRKANIKSWMEEAIIAGDNKICPYCGKSTYLVALENGPDDYKLTEFCPDGCEIWES